MKFLTALTYRVFYYTLFYVMIEMAIALFFYPVAQAQIPFSGIKQAKGTPFELYMRCLEFACIKSKNSTQVLYLRERHIVILKYQSQVPTHYVANTRSNELPWLCNVSFQCHADAIHYQVNELDTTGWTEVERELFVPEIEKQLELLILQWERYVER